MSNLRIWPCDRGLCGRYQIFTLEYQLRVRYDCKNIYGICDNGSTYGDLAARDRNICVIVNSAIWLKI